MRPVAGTGQLCSQLSSGDGAEVLVTDFQALNGTPRLSQLLGKMATDQRIYQVDPRGALSGGRLYASLAELADEAAALFRAESSAAGDQRLFVVSHCSAAALSLRIAGHLSAVREVTAILVQPTWPGTEHVVEGFSEFQAKLGAGGQPCPDLDGDPWSCVAEMEQLMRAEMTELAKRHGLDSAPLAFSELLVSYRTWLAFLLACRNDRPAEPPAEAVEVTVLTDDPHFVLPGTGPGRYRITPPPTRDRPDDVTPELARLVLDQIESWPAAGSR
ncbi:hypothetical protein ACFYON_07850 [Micromonospora sp. NPDC005686]|uniref:hypothetical protein n=1 Tax=unclassified Micromonospora TaxID=2617518 RepID=UPI0033A5B05D